MRFNVFAILILGLLAGCEADGNDFSGFTAAEFPIEGKPLNRIDIVNMIDPENRRSMLRGTYCASRRGDGDPNKAELRRTQTDTDDFESTDLQCAVSAFDTYFMSYNEFLYFLENYGVTSSSIIADSELSSKPFDSSGGLGLYDDFQKRKAHSYALALRRNEIQDMVKRHSDEFCRRFEENTVDTKTLFQLISGSLATTLGGLGAIFTDAGVARALAGAAGITSGLNAEYESAVFQQQAITTIFAGVALRRQSILGEIDRRRTRIINPKDEPETKVYSSLVDGDQIIDGAFPIRAADIEKLSKEKNFVYLVDDEVSRVTTPITVTVEADASAGADKNDVTVARDNDENEPSRALVSIASYTLERAMGDVLIYHQACSLTQGLIEAERSIERIREREFTEKGERRRGLDEVNEIQQRINELEQKYDAFKEQEDK